MHHDGNFFKKMSFTEFRKAVRAISAQNSKLGRTLIPEPVPQGVKEISRSSPGWKSPIAAFRSCDYLVQVFDERDRGAIVRLTVNRASIDERTRDWCDGIPWEELQRIKNECGYSEFEAVEVYPIAGDEVNVSNMRHLWVLHQRLPFAWLNSRQK